jgi:hypothetical protein
VNEPGIGFLVVEDGRIDRVINVTVGPGTEPASDILKRRGVIGNQDIVRSEKDY